MIQSLLAKRRQIVARTEGSAGTEPPARGTDRIRRILLTGGASALARVVQISTSLITVPVTLKYLGNERFGLWMTISSVLAMAAFADFGVGNGVLNAVAKAYGRDDIEAIRKAVSSGFAILTSLAALLLLSFFLIYPHIDWSGFFRVSSTQARMEAGPALAVFACCFALNISLDVVQRVQLGLQQGYLYGMWQLSGSVFGLVGILAGIWFHASLPLLIVAIAGAPVLSTIMNAIHFFGFLRPDLRPSIGMVSMETAIRIVRLGSLFFVLQLAVSVSYSSDNVILTRVLGPLAVAQYAVPSRLFGFIGMLTSFLTTPLWPAYAEALERKDHRWIKRTLYRSLLLVGGASVAASTLLVLFAPSIIRLWVGPGIQPSVLLLVAMAMSSVICAIASTIGMFLNGLSVIRFQVLLAIVGSIANVFFSISLTRRLGTPGVVFGTILAQLLIGVVPYYLFVTRYIRTTLAEPILPHTISGAL